MGNHKERIIEDQQIYSFLLILLTRKQYGRDEFYKWCEENFKIEGNSKAGKLMVGVSYRESGGCLLDNSDSDED